MSQIFFAEITNSLQFRVTTCRIIQNFRILGETSTLNQIIWTFCSKILLMEKMNFSANMVWMALQTVNFKFDLLLLE